MAGEDPRYLAWVRTLPCSVPDCRAPSEAHHITGAGMSLRSHDHDTMPLCRWHHATFHDLTGHFKGWLKHERRRWQREKVARVQALAAQRPEALGPLPDPDAF
jgi:hypothetical protein